MDPVLRTLLLERLETSELDAEAKSVIELAADAAAPPPTTDASPPVWLKEVTVEGFRGIGRPATLKLEPAPGLTVVVGRNGSGKSSFAEGLELLMTGALKRWEKRPKAWSETWQCLHFTGPTKITAELQLEGGETVPLTQEWPHGALYGDASGRAAPAARARASTGGTATCRRSARSWPTPSWRRCSTRSARSTTRSRRCSASATWTRSPPRSPQTRLAYDAQRKAVAGEKDQLVARLDPDDDRAALVKAAIGGRKPDLAQLDGAAGGDAELHRGPHAAAPPLRPRAPVRRADPRRVPGPQGRRARARRRERDRRRPRDLARHAAAPGARGPATARTARCARRRTCWTTRGCRPPRRKPRSWRSRRRRSRRPTPSSRSRAAAWSRCSTATRSPPRRPRSISASPRSSSSSAATKRPPRRRSASCASSPRRRPRSSSARARPGRSSPATCAAGSRRPRTSRPRPSR